MEEMQSKEIEGRNTRARAKRLVHTTDNNESLSKMEISGLKTRSTRNTPSAVKDAKNKDESFVKSNTIDKELNSSTVSVQSKTAKRSRKKMRNSSKDESFTPEKSLSVLINNQSDVVLNETITPKQNSPVVINFSAKRTSKTPKRSPKALASPKSHSVELNSSVRVSRKLVLPGESPASNDKKHTKGIVQHTPQLKSKSNITPSPTKKRKSLINTSGEQFKVKSHSLSLKFGVRRFSKSPKIVLRTPKPKSKRSSLPQKMNLSGLHFKLGEKVGTPTKTAIKISTPNTEPRKRKHKETEEADTTPSVKSNKPLKLPSLWNAMAFKQPVVLLERLPIPEDKASISFSNSQRIKNMMSSFMHSPIISSAKSSPLDTVTDLKRTTRSRDTLTDSPQHSNQVMPANPSGKETSNQNSHTPADNAHKLTVPLMSSTPHDRRKRLGQNNVSIISASKIGQRTSPRTKANSSNTDTSKLIEDISEPSLCPLNMTETLFSEQIESEEPEKKKDGTYELAEPKTPMLREKTKKRSLEDENLNNTREIKRNVRVRFMSPVAIIDSTKKNSVKRAEKGRIEKVHSSKHSTIKKVLFDSGNSKERSHTYSHQRSNSITNSSSKRSPNNKNLKRSNSYAEKNTSSFRFSPNKSGSNINKTDSVTKKAPNFSNIHTKMFAKMESLVDNNKRLQERHALLTTGKGNTPNRSLNPSVVLGNDTMNSQYTRFGFKLRKKEATERVMQKSQLTSKSDKQQKNRDFIRGVRTNKRFELLMKARNVKV